MPKVVDVNLDAAEMVLKLEKENSPTKIEYTKLERLVKSKASVRKLFRTVEVESVEVHVKGMSDPIVIESHKFGDYESITGFLDKVAEKYGVTVDA